IRIAPTRKSVAHTNGSRWNQITGEFSITRKRQALLRVGKIQLPNLQAPLESKRLRSEPQYRSCHRGKLPIDPQTFRAWPLEGLASERLLKGRRITFGALVFVTRAYSPRSEWLRQTS